MKAIKLLLIIYCLFTLTSCKPIYKFFNGVNKTKEFNNRKEYVEYLFKKYEYDKQKIYFIEPENIGRLMRYIKKEEVSYFYGITLNDSLKINDQYLKENNSCFGRISKIINSENGDYKTKLSQLSKFDLKNIDNKSIDFNRGKSIIFIISTKLGTGINKDIKNLSNEVISLQNPNINYYLISVDNLKQNY